MTFSVFPNIFKARRLFGCKQYATTYSLMQTLQPPTHEIFFQAHHMTSFAQVLRGHLCDAQSYCMWPNINFFELVDTYSQLEVLTGHRSPSHDIWIVPSLWTMVSWRSCFCPPPAWRRKDDIWVRCTSVAQGGSSARGLTFLTGNCQSRTPDWSGNGPHLTKEAEDTMLQ